jgi:hypothetical protein
MQHIPCGALASIVPSQSCWQHAHQPPGRVGPLNGALLRAHLHGDACQQESTTLLMHCVYVCARSQRAIEWVLLPRSSLCNDRLPLPVRGVPSQGWHVTALVRVVTPSLWCGYSYEQAQESSDGAEGRGATLLPGAFTGQWVGAGHLVGDNEWRAHLMLEQAGVSHARIATELLTRAHDQFKQQQAPSSSSTCNRLFAHLIAQMAGEYMRLLDYTNARRLLVSMASVYRREGWEQLLCAALQSLRECARRLGTSHQIHLVRAQTAEQKAHAHHHSTRRSSSVLTRRTRGCAAAGLHREHAENSLELSALRLSMDIEQRMALFASALAVLTEPLPASPPPASGAKDQTLQLGYLIHETSPLRTVLSCMGCFHTAEVSCGTSCTFTVALQARVPLDVPIWKLEVHFNHQEFDTSRGRSSWGGANQEPAVLMTPYTWVYVHFPITSSTPTTYVPTSLGIRILRLLLAPFDDGLRDDVVCPAGWSALAWWLTWVQPPSSNGSLIMLSRRPSLLRWRPLPPPLPIVALGPSSGLTVHHLARSKWSRRYQQRHSTSTVPRPPSSASFFQSS